MLNIERPFLAPIGLESDDKSSFVLPSRGFKLIGIRFYTYEGEEGMSRREAQCIQKSLYGSTNWFYFNQGFNVIEDNDEIKGVDVRSDAFDSSFFLFSEPDKVSISVSAIVGQNGTGKSTIVDNVIRIINNLSAAVIGEDYVYSSAQHLHYIDNVYASLAFYQESSIKIVTCKGRKLTVTEFCADISEETMERYTGANDFTEHYLPKNPCTVLDGTSNSNDILLPQEGLKSILRNWFYTLVGNYSLYAYNYRDYLFEWSSEEKISKLKREDDKDSDSERRCWLKGVFHKNDGYQTPIVIHPMRNNGYIDAHKVNYIGKQNLISLCFEKRNNRDFPFRTINQTHHIVAFAFDNPLPHPYEGFEAYWLEKRLSPGNPKLKSILLELEDPIKAFWSKHIGVSLPQKGEMCRYLRATWDYLVYKTIKVIWTYKQYEPLWKKIESGQFSDSLNEDLVELMRDSSHRTLKIRRAVCYIRFCSERDYYMSKGVTVPVDTISEWMETKIGEQIYPNTDYHKITIDDLLPTPVADVILQLVDNEHIESYRQGHRNINIIPFGGLSSGERQIAYMIANIIYHLKNIESNIHDMNGKPEHAFSFRYNYANIMLDEVELYFHPDLQRRFIKLLIDSIGGLDLPSNSGVNITLVTHSPFVLSDIPESNIMFLSRNKGDRINGGTFAANIHDLFNNTFILENTIGEFAQEQLKELISCYNFIGNTQTPASGWKIVSKDFLTKRKKHKYAYLSQIIGDDYLKSEISDMVSEMTESPEIIESQS